MLAGIAAPVSLLKECAGQGTYHLALSHMILTSDEYRAFYRAEVEEGVMVGVDNGIVECGQSLPLQRVIDAAGMIDATEFVLPDVLGDGEASWSATIIGLQLYEEMGRPGDFGLMAVPHGRDMRDWMACYLRILDLEAVRVIGISMFDHDLHPGGRVGLLDALEDLKLIDVTRSYHMLGCWRDLREAYGLATRCRSHEYSQGWYVETRDYVRSMDTGLPVRWGLQDLRCPALRCPQKPPVAEHRKDDFHAPATMNGAIQHNIDLYKRCCEGYYE